MRSVRIKEKYAISSSQKFLLLNFFNNVRYSQNIKIFLEILKISKDYISDDFSSTLWPGKGGTKT
jgi:hypothetical protein